MVARGTDRLPVADGQGHPMGTLHLADLLRGADRR
ncbi:CBS domain-containing protein [Azospirillum brasilense]